MKKKIVCLLIVCMSVLLVGIVSYGADFTEVDATTTRVIQKESDYNSEISVPITKEELSPKPSLLNINVPTDIYMVGYLDYDMAYQVLDLVNQERRNAGLNELQMDTSLLDSAMHRAAETGLVFDHTRPNGLDCFTMDDRMWAENIAAGQPTAQLAMESWMTSEGHKANILNESMNCIGIGCFNFQGIYYWTQCFGVDKAQVPTKPDNALVIAKISAITENLQIIIDTNEVTLKPQETHQSMLYNVNIGFPIQGSGIQPESAVWTTSDSKVATVNKEGLITAVGVGTATITATIQDIKFDVTVKVDLPFKDVTRDKWYYNSVEYCYKNGIIMGTTDTTFSPNNNLTRGNLVTLLYRMEGYPKVDGEVSFPDVKASDYFYEAVKWAEKTGIVHGYETGKFGPNNNISREQLATILFNYAKYKKKDTSARTDLNKFTDNNKISSYAREAVSWAVAKGVMSGKNEGTRVDPQGRATRAEAAAMIQNYCSYVGR